MAPPELADEHSCRSSSESGVSGMLKSFVSNIRSHSPTGHVPDLSDLSSLDVTARATNAAVSVTGFVVEIPSRLRRNRFVQLFLACTVGTIALYIQLSTSISKAVFGTDITASPFWWLCVVPAQVVFVVYFLRFLMRFLVIDLGLSLLRSASMRDALASLVRDLVLHAEVQDEKLAEGVVSLAAKVVAESNRSGYLNERLGDAVAQVIQTERLQDAVVDTLTGALRHPELPGAVAELLGRREIGSQLSEQVHNELVDCLSDQRTADAAAVFVRHVLDDQKVRQTAMRRMKSMLSKPDVHRATCDGVTSMFSSPCPSTGCWSSSGPDDPVPSELAVHGWGDLSV